MIATLSNVSWRSVVTGMDEGFRSTIDDFSKIEDRLTFQVMNDCWRLFKLQQSFCSAGFTIARPIALGLIGVNLFSKIFIQTILYGYKSNRNEEKWTIFTRPAKWLQEKIDPAALNESSPSTEHGRTLFLWSNFATIMTPSLLRAADFCEGFVQLEKNWTQGFAKIATMSAIFWSLPIKKYTDDTELDHPLANLLGKYSYDILDLFVRINVKICAIYQNSIFGNCTRSLITLPYTAARHIISSGNYRELLNIDSANITNTFNALSHVYEIGATLISRDRLEKFPPDD